MIKLVQKAQSSKPNVQLKVDKITAVFVPFVLLISLITFFTWMLYGGFDYFTMGFNSAINILIIACPCALGLATPTAIVVAIGKAAKYGVLIKNFQSFEDLNQMITL